MSSLHAFPSLAQFTSEDFPRYKFPQFPTHVIQLFNLYPQLCFKDNKKLFKHTHKNHTHTAPLCHNWGSILTFFRAVIVFCLLFLFCFKQKERKMIKGEIHIWKERSSKQYNLFKNNSSKVRAKLNPRSNLDVH